MPLRLDAMADLLAPLGAVYNRPDVPDALRAQSPLDEQFPPFVKRIVAVTTLWPLYCACSYLALGRPDADVRFVALLRDVMSTLIAPYDGDGDPVRYIVDFAFLCTVEAHDAAAKRVLPHDVAERALLHYCTVHDGGPTAILYHHEVDPNGEMAQVAHRTIGKIGRNFLAREDVPRGYDDRLYAVVGAILDHVGILHRRRVSA